MRLSQPGGSNGLRTQTPYPNQADIRLRPAMFADDQNVSLAPGMQPGRVSANMLDQAGGQVVAGSNPVSPTGFDAGQERFRKIWDRLSSVRNGSVRQRVRQQQPTSPRLGPFRDRRSLPEHGADRAVPLGPHLDPLGPLLGQPHEQRHAGRHAVQFGVVLAAALELFA